MKLLPLVLLLVVFSSAVCARSADPICLEFRSIQRTMKAIDQKSVEQVLPRADWLDRQYRRQDVIVAGSTIGRTIILVLLQRMSFVTYLFIPSRAEAATVSGSYVRNPQAYVRFLQLSPEDACSIMSLVGNDTQLLRDLTHEVYLELQRASR